MPVERDFGKSRDSRMDLEFRELRGDREDKFQKTNDSVSTDEKKKRNDRVNDGH